MKYIFEAKTIQRMELLVLSVLDWRLRSVTPFSFLSFFAYKIDPQGTSLGLFLTHATKIILSNTKGSVMLYILSYVHWSGSNKKNNIGRSELS